MKPIASLPAETARRLRGVVFDVDDTITDEGRVGGIISSRHIGIDVKVNDSGLSTRRMAPALGGD